MKFCSQGARYHTLFRLIVCNVHTATGLCFGEGKLKAGDHLENQSVEGEDNIEIDFQ